MRCVIVLGEHALHPDDVLRRVPHGDDRDIIANVKDAAVLGLHVGAEELYRLLWLEVMELDRLRVDVLCADQSGGNAQRERELEEGSHGCCPRESQTTVILGFDVAMIAARWLSPTVMPISGIS